MLFTYANQIQHHMTTVEAKRFTLFIDVHAISYIMMIGAAVLKQMGSYTAQLSLPKLECGYKNAIIVLRSCLNLHDNSNLRSVGFPSKSVTFISYIWHNIHQALCDLDQKP